MRGIAKMSNVPNMLRTVVMDVLFCLLICRHLVLNLFSFPLTPAQLLGYGLLIKGIFTNKCFFSATVYPRPWPPHPSVKCIPSVRTHRNIYRWMKYGGRRKIKKISLYLIFTLYWFVSRFTWPWNEYWIRTVMYLCREGFLFLPCNN